MTIDAVNIRDTDVFDDLPKTNRLGNSIRCFRKCDEITLTDAAKALGISKQLLSNYERGKQLPSLQKVMDMATILGAPAVLWIQYRINDEISKLDFDYTVTLTKKDAS